MAAPIVQRAIPGLFDNIFMDTCFPIAKVTYCLITGTPTPHPSDTLRALAVLGLQISGVGIVYSICTGKLIPFLGFSATSAIFTASCSNIEQIKKIEALLEDLKTTNTMLRNNTETFKKHADSKIKEIADNAEAFKKEKDLLIADLGILAKLIEDSNITLASLEKLKQQEKESIAKYEIIRIQLETTSQAFIEQKALLEKEITRLSSEITRLEKVPAQKQPTPALTAIHQKYLSPIRA